MLGLIICFANRVPTEIPLFINF
ncbi:hypothetical protein [Pedobacter sp. MC2016-05]